MPGIQRTITALFITLAMTCAAHAVDTIRYVNKSNTNPTQDGLTWQTSFTTIQPAIDSAFSAGGGEVWIAQGTYSELRAELDLGGELSGSVVLRDSVSLYGGFVGNEISRESRSRDAQLTVIDGSTSRNGEPALNAVLTEVPLEGSVVISDLTVTGGRATGSIEDQDNRHRSRGGGMYLIGVVFIDNCRVVSNHANARGGGLYGGAVTNSYISDNTCDGSAGGTSNSVLTSTIIRNNWAGKAAGGAHISSEIRDCVFINNRCGGTGSSSGGGALELSDGETLVINCLFVGNSSTTSDGGGAINIQSGYNENSGTYSADVSIINCTFAGSISKRGGVINHNQSILTMGNCIIWGNESPWISGDSISRVNISNCVIQDNYNSSSTYTLTNILNDNPLFVNPAGRDYRLRPQSVAIDAGSDLDAPDTDLDLDGNARPLGDGYDIGAYEFDPEVPFEDPFDATGDSSVNATDIQHLINQVLGTTSPITDINNDGTTNAADIQLIINRVLGLI